MNSDARSAVSADEWNWQSDWPAPAKLNLFLHVVGRRDDGYHLLQTVFRFIDYGDTLRFEPRSDSHIVLANPLPGVLPETDLTYRAAVALQSASNVSQGATIHLTKHLPMGGGLGGGSSDAATTLIALNHLWNTGLSRERLQQIGLTLGADVPVFVFGRTTFAEGIGEQFTGVDAQPSWYLVAKPPVSVPTVEIFKSPTLRRNTAKIEASGWLDGFGNNDMEPVASELYPAVADCLTILRSYGDARMSGSGACCFVSFASQSEAQSAAEALQILSPETSVTVARGLDRHPLWGLQT
jgi:4-diphosphocytidyl-2-C-methyl-D-erythritol kinase